MGRRGTARCNNCSAHIVFFRSPFTGRVRAFDAKPVEPSHPLAGVKAFPILGGTAAYKAADLVDLLQVQRQTSDADAAAEVQDMPWHLFHECPELDSTDSARSADVDHDLLEAAKYVVSTQFGSISMLRRQLDVSYAHADQLMGRLEEHGVVGPVRAAQSREVLVRADRIDEVLAALRGGDQS